MNASGSFNAWFVGRLDEIALSYSDMPSAIFFLGMSRNQSELIAASDYAVGTLRSAMNECGAVDLAAFSISNRATFRELLNSEGPVFLLYEQLKDIRGSLSEMYDGRVVVVNNNLFSPSEGYPSSAKTEQLEQMISLITEADVSDSDKNPNCYADVSKVGDEYLVNPVLVHEDLDCAEVDLCQKAPFSLRGVPGKDAVIVSGASYLSFRIRLCLGDVGCVSFMLDEHEAQREHALAWLLDACGIPYAASIVDAGNDNDLYDGARLLPLLKKYWGECARFRGINFYRNPDINNEMTSVSQGHIADYVTHQAEDALDGFRTFRNVFVTAPTGAGKSLLFQLPALYLAQNRHAVTLVIEPLKQLMIDQVRNLRKQGVACVAAINSDIPYEERLAEYKRIRTGETSIIYLSPELLLGSSIDTILNGRTLGLVVIDEVHTVTSWGIDFRPDYWYLGSFLAKLRRRGMLFPTFCLTATAVYGGKDDVVSRSIATLELGNCKIYLGNPRRDNIGFDIRVRDKKDFAGPIEEVKTELACEWVKQSAAVGDHAIVYCPYRSHVDAIIESLPDMGTKVMGFHAGYDSECRRVVSEAFKKGSCRTLVSTKAFGMGIDIKDINAIYHYAPTGNLADYVQEIGRSARKGSLQASAIIDYFSQDSRYARQLYAMSRFAQWQLREVMWKLYALYAARPKQSRSMNLLVSPSSFSYLFADGKNETEKTNRVKAALMMIAQDLEEHYNFPVIVVQPKPSYAKQFVCIDGEHETRLVKKYQKYLHKLSDGRTHFVIRPGQSVARVSDMGPIYTLDLASMWEECFPDLTFAQFKYSLFAGEIEGDGARSYMSPRLSLMLSFKDSFETAASQFDIYINALVKILLDLQRAGQFTVTQFRNAFESELGPSVPHPRKIDTLLKALVLPTNSDEHMAKCLFKSVHPGKPMQSFYTVKSKYLSSIASKARRALDALKPSKGNSIRLFLNPRVLGNRYEVIELLQILDLATYEIRGGNEPEIFVRLNDPHKVRALAGSENYSNKVLKRLNESHEYASRVVSSFFRTSMGDEERWDLIEEYFLGNDDYVAWALDMGGVEGTVRRKVQFRGERKLALGLSATLDSEIPVDSRHTFRIWRSLLSECTDPREVSDLETLKRLTRGTCFAAPIDHPVLTIESTGAKLHPLLAWKEQRILLFPLAQTEDFESAQKVDWHCYFLGQGDGIEQLAEDIKVDGKES